MSRPSFLLTLAALLVALTILSPALRAVGWLVAGGPGADVAALAHGYRDPGGGPAGAARP